jgi:hypothetical protein
MGKQKSIMSSPSISDEAMLQRFRDTGELEKVDASPNSWYMNFIPGWVQGEWIPPVIVREWINQGVAEIAGNKIIITEKGRTGKYDFHLHKKNILANPSLGGEPRTSSEDSSDSSEEVKRRVVKDKPPRISAEGKVSRIGDHTPVKLLSSNNTRKGVETILAAIWQKFPDSTATATELANELVKVKAVSDKMDSARFWIKKAMERGDAQVAE